MDIHFRYGKDDIQLKVPDDSLSYAPQYEPTGMEGCDMLLDSIANPTGCLPLGRLLQEKRKGHVAIVVSDITRPIPYRSFLPHLLEAVGKEGIRREEIVILVATGMHRPSTHDEKIYMFGKDIVDNYTIVDHEAENESTLSLVEGTSWSGAEIKLNRYYVEAGFRIITGLVEPHFMAGFSGGRKAICPGLASLKTVQMFHGYRFLSHPNAANTLLADNPCHLENTSIARLCPADFSINIVLDQERNINRIMAGEQTVSLEKTISYVKEKSCRKVESLADVAITSCGGYPLDDTFYQCVKGFVNCLPAIKQGAEIIAFGSCTEGTGSAEYTSIMKKYAFRHDDFINDIRDGRFFIKDQWQLQMHIRVLEKTGQQNLHFFTAGIPSDVLALLSVNGHPTTRAHLVDALQNQIDEAVASGKRIAVFPEGPYCSPV